MSHYFIAILIHASDGRDVCRCRHVFNDCIQKFLNAFISICGSAAYRNCRTLASCFSEYFLQVVNRWLVSFQIFHHKIIIKIADLLYQFCVVKFCVILHVFRNIYNGDVLALLIIVDVGFHLHQVDDSLEIIFLADWQLKADRILSKSCLNLFYSIVEICTQNVHLVDECHSWYIVCVSLTPYVF